MSSAARQCPTRAKSNMSIGWRISDRQLAAQRHPARGNSPPDAPALLSTNGQVAEHRCMTGTTSVTQARTGGGVWLASPSFAPARREGVVVRRQWDRIAPCVGALERVH